MARATGFILPAGEKPLCCSYAAATKRPRLPILKRLKFWRRNGPMALETFPWDSAEYLDSREEIVAYIEAAFEDGDPALITHALGVVARAKGMSQIARETGLTREGLYKALTTDG